MKSHRFHHVSRTLGASVGQKAKTGSRHLRRKAEKLMKKHLVELKQVIKQLEERKE